MTNANHTPGPWAVKHNEICGPDDVDGDDVVLAAVGVSYGLRSSTYSIIRKGSEMEANARLMAAAPDLLAALREFVHPYQSATLTEREQREKALAAIAKAEGRE